MKTNEYLQALRDYPELSESKFVLHFFDKWTEEQKHNFVLFVDNGNWKKVYNMVNEKLNSCQFSKIKNINSLHYLITCIEIDNVLAVK